MSKIRLFLVFIMFLSPALSHASALLKPNISGLSGGFYKAAANDVHYANGAYSASGLASLGAYNLSLGASIPLAANAAQIVKDSMMLNPYKIVGTLAAGWLLQQGFQWATDHWTKTDSSVPVYNSGLWYWNGDLNMAHTGSGPVEVCNAYGMTGSVTPNNYYGAGTGGDCHYANGAGNGTAITKSTTPGTPATTTVSQADWDALPDPLPVLAPELPYAPYINGAPVSDPVYQPGDYPLSDPYSNPDNSTSQERAKVTPASGGQVNVETYSQPVTDTAGNPVANPTPTPTDTKQTECQQHPETLGCLDAGTDSFAMPTKSLTFSYSPEVSPIGNGTCPAPISVLGQSLSFQTSCDAMGMIKPLVIAIASLMAAYILLGAFRGGD